MSSISSIGNGVYQAVTLPYRATSSAFLYVANKIREFVRGFFEGAFGFFIRPIVLQHGVYNESIGQRIFLEYFKGGSYDARENRGKFDP